MREKKKLCACDREMTFCTSRGQRRKHNTVYQFSFSFFLHSLLHNYVSTYVVLFFVSFVNFNFCPV